MLLKAIHLSSGIPFMIEVSGTKLGIFLSIWDMPNYSGKVISCSAHKQGQFLHTSPHYLTGKEESSSLTNSVNELPSGRKELSKVEKFSQICF